MKKIKLLMPPMLMLPLVAAVSCNAASENKDKIYQEKLANNYQLESSIDLQKVFKDAIVEIPDNVVQGMFSGIQDITPQGGYDAQVLRGTLESDSNYGFDDHLILIKGGKVMQYTDQNDISYSALPSNVFNLDASFDSKLLEAEATKYSPIRWDRFGVTKDTFKDVVSAFVITSTLSGASVSVKQIKFETAQNGIVWKEVIDYDTNLFGKSKVEIDEDAIPDTVNGPFKLGQFDKYNFDYLKKQINSPISDEERQEATAKLKRRIQYSNEHLNRLFNDSLSVKERVDNKNISRKFVIGDDANSLLYYEGDVEYIVNVDTSKFTTDPKGAITRTVTLNFVKWTNTKDSTSGTYQGITGPQWKTLIDPISPNKGYTVNKHYINAFFYIIGFFNISDPTLKYDSSVSEIAGLSPVAKEHEDWVQEGVA